MPVASSTSINKLQVMQNAALKILPRLTRRTLSQLRTNKSPFLKLYLHKIDAKTHSSPLCPLFNTHTHDTHHLFNCTHIRTIFPPRFVDRLRRSECTGGLVDEEAGWWTTSRKIRLPPLARVMGVARQQHHSALDASLCTHSLDPCLWGESDHPTFGSPTSISFHLASNSITPAGSVHKSRCVCGCS